MGVTISGETTALHRLQSAMMSLFTPWQGFVELVKHWLFDSIGCGRLVQVVA